MVLPAVEHADESFKWCFMAERGAVNDVAILSHYNATSGEEAFTIGL